MTLEMLRDANRRSSREDALPIDWSRYTLRTEVVDRDTASLKPFRFTALNLPPLAVEDFVLLQQSIRANGVQEPLTITSDGEVVDGQARLRAARHTGLARVPTRVLESHGGEQGYDAWAAVTNMGRRHLTPGQRLGLIKAVLKILEENARERQKATRFGENRNDVASTTRAVGPNLDSPSTGADVRTTVGALIGVSRSQAAKMVDLVKHGSGELQEGVVSGRVSIHRAHQALTGRAEKRSRRGGRQRRHRAELAGDPVGTLRMVACLLPEWVDNSRGWTPAKRNEFLQALRNILDSCEQACRRLVCCGG